MNTTIAYYVPVYYPIEIFNQVMVNHNFPNIPQPIVYPPTTVIPDIIPHRLIENCHRNILPNLQQPVKQQYYESQDKKSTPKAENFSEQQGDQVQQPQFPQQIPQPQKAPRKRILPQNLQRVQNETRNVNSNILKNFFKACLREEALNIRRICEIHNIEDEKIFLQEFKKRVNVKQHYVKTSGFMKMLNEKSDFGKILRVLLRKYAKTECVNTILSSSRLRKKQKELHINHRFDVINQVLP